jgi:hypothetical protein
MPSLLSVPSVMQDLSPQPPLKGEGSRPSPCRGGAGGGVPKTQSPRGIAPAGACRFRPLFYRV